MTALKDRSLRQMPWWLWPDLLCLVAPIAALCWQGLFAKVTNVKLPPVAHQTLFLTVWIIAVLDRMMEARVRKEAWRHWFAARFALLLWLLLAVAFGVVFWLLFWALPQVILELGVFLVVPVGFYLFFARLDVGPRGALPRELVRGALFSAGVLLPTYGMANVPPAALQLMIAQTLLVSLIFLAVTCCEHLKLGREPGQAEWQAIDSRVAIWLAVLLVTVLWLARVESDGSVRQMSIYYVAMAVSGLLFLIAHWRRRRLTPDTLHGVAWLVLLVPLLPLLFLEFDYKQEAALAPSGAFDEHWAARFEDGVGLDEGFVLTPEL